MRYLAALTFNFAATILWLLPALEAADDCYGQICQSPVEYCSSFAEGCLKCATVCDEASHNYHAATCARECPEHKRLDPLQAEIRAIHTQQHLILILLVLLLALIVVRYAYKCIRWLRRRRCVTLILKKLQPKQSHSNKDAVDGGAATTIRNIMTINDTERAQSQDYSVTGADNTVVTMTTPVSTRYPAENSTTPTTNSTEHSYDNQALAVTPVSEKPNTTQSF